MTEYGPNHLFSDESRDIFEELEQVIHEPRLWLSTPNDVLGGRAPKDLIGTDDEYLLRDVAQRIKHGVFS